MPKRSFRAGALSPQRAVPGARVTVQVNQRGSSGSGPLAGVEIGGTPARVVFASPSRVTVIVPESVGSGSVDVVVEGAGAVGRLDVARVVATGLHQVDNPAFDADGNLYVAYSGPRGEQVPVSVFRIRPDGTREPFVSGIVNATSMALDEGGDLYVSSRFEGTVYRVRRDGTLETFATDLGVACGLVFGRDGELFIGDRSGTIFRRDPSGRTTMVASLPPSVAAYHLAIGGDGSLYVTGPTLSSYDSVYRVRVDLEREQAPVEIVSSAFGRPQGLAFDRDGVLHVVDAAAGWNGVYRVLPSGNERIVAGTDLVGLAFDPGGGLVVSSNETAYRFDVDRFPLQEA